ncbi:Dihydroorotate dehydrogenase (NAD(+)), electron transfer subunit [hydrothermal vent metagenome]|uniref:Dihydroorotate dehydrogenase (NAD(+)), electron transfer subunit n=1 Tax=hydrothermal vent metagenome TaxID=652676 RepID=A0A3B0ZYM3_9ZZZZ
MTKDNRNTILSESCKIISHQAFKGEQFIVTVLAPEISKRALAGSFVHIQTDSALAMRRPISIMQADPESGTITLLYKVLGHGTKLLSQRKIGESLDILGPIGTPFELHSDKTIPLLIGGGVGLPPMVFIADTIQKFKKQFTPFVIMGSEVPFPFQTQPSKLTVNGIPDAVNATMPLLEEWNIASRLCSLQNYTGCYQGYVTDLAKLWLASLSPQQLAKVEIFSCGPNAMLAAVSKLAKQYDLPCQVSLEEYMACAVGGCAGCVVKIKTKNEVAMKRVCVDGPVFDAHQVVMFQ